jgi:hypothetical protein
MNTLTKATFALTPQQQKRADRAAAELGADAPETMNYEPPRPPKPEPPSLGEFEKDALEEIMTKWDAHQRSVDQVLLAKVNWEKEMRVLSESDDATDDEVDRLSKINAELTNVGPKLEVLNRRGATIMRQMRREFGIRFYRLQQLAHTIFVERRDKAVQFLLPRCEKDAEVAYQAALTLPDVHRAEERVNSFAFINATDVVTGSRQLLTLQKELVEDGKQLAKK